MTNILTTNIITDTHAILINSVTSNALLSNTFTSKVRVFNIIAINVVTVNNIVINDNSRRNHTISVGDCIQCVVGNYCSEGDFIFVTQLNSNRMFGIHWVLVYHDKKRVRPEHMVELNPLAVTTRCTSVSTLKKPYILFLSHCSTQCSITDASLRMNTQHTTTRPASASVTRF